MSKGKRGAPGLLLRVCLKNRSSRGNEAHFECRVESAECRIDQSLVTSAATMKMAFLRHALSLVLWLALGISSAGDLLFAADSEAKSQTNNLIAQPISIADALN